LTRDQPVRMLLTPEAIADARTRLRPTATPQSIRNQSAMAHATWVQDPQSVSLLPMEQLINAVCKQCRAVPCTCKEPLTSGCPPVQGLAHIRTGKLEGATYAIAVPVDWNGRLLLYLHGTRPLGAPLVAELDIFDDAFSHLLSDGWMLATTSYRSHGLALTDALADTINLHLHLCGLFGMSEMVLIEGRSMGGTAGILLAERHPEKFSAVVTVGAALLNARLALEQTGSSGQYANQVTGAGREALTNRPLIPLILVVNESELSPARSYVASAWEHHNAKDKDVIVPALWEIKRPGHNWVTDSERLNAVLHAAAWVTDGTFITRRGTPAMAAPDFEPTHGPSPTPEGMYTVVNGCRVRGAVVCLTPTCGFTISTPREALASIGIRRGCKFRLWCDEGDTAPLPVRVTLDEYPFVNSREYDWCAAFEPVHEWLNVFVRTYEYCNAAKLFQVKLGLHMCIEAEVPSARGGKAGSLVKAAQLLLTGSAEDVPAASSRAAGKGAAGLPKGNGKCKKGKTMTESSQQT